MRTANEQRAVMERILKVWQKYPHLRLGQLFANMYPVNPVDTYYIEDSELVRFAESYNPERVK